MSKHVWEKCRKWADGRTDGHHHTIIRPVWRRAYKKTQRVKFILYIYIVYMCLDCVLSITVFEIYAFNLKLWRYAQYMEDPRKNSSVRQQPFHHKWKENFKISWSIIFLSNDSCFQTNLQHNYFEKNNERHCATSPEMRMMSVIRLHSNATSITS